ncbi:hypothetical protein SPBR_05570 [Sporothrix brasiliensis 5110]|uniref:Uncharacterized protein n=1 Tax=Sporothrix brasiliensis 5110 TaxID=1398154 RepID=A0A0C2F6G0_9PEZI|nr:uncharacterized protein SPBR_05570 [Sporothrix brasiliensis 5110]KIH94534.1 hypothetical protein SPBR_05570 [Sporothrix brasiliensis 5110]
MATVAAADAERKVRQRRDQGQRLDDARQELLRILHDPSPLDYNLTNGLPPSSVDEWPPSDNPTVPAPTIDNTPTTTSRNAVIEAIKAICVPPAQLRRHAADTKQREAYLTWLHAQFGIRRRWWSPRPALDAGLENLTEALLEEEMATQHTLLEGQREPQKAVHFAKMTEATNRLVDSLIIEGHRIGSFDDPVAQKRSMESLESPWHAMRMLRSDGYPSFRLPNLDPAATTAARREANEAARNIFRTWSQARIYGRPRASALQMAMGRTQNVTPAVWNAKEVKFWVAKLCYNMLVSSAPPGIHNYNTLILGFISVGQHTLAQLVADSLLYDTRLLPTQQTLVCLLHQARAQGDLVGFHRVLRRIVALDPRGIKIRRRATPDVARYGLHREWARNNDVNLASGYVVQRADVDGPVVEAVIWGLLSLDQVRHAAVVFSTYLDDCTHMDASTLNSVLDPVLDAVDIPGARVLLRGFSKNASIVNRVLLSETRSAEKLAMRIRILLAIATAPEPALQAQPKQEPPRPRQRQAVVTHAASEAADDELQETTPEPGVEDEDEYWTEEVDDYVEPAYDNIPELAYARNLRADGKPLSKSQIRMLKQFDAATAASREVDMAAEEQRLESQRWLDRAAKNMHNGTGYGYGYGSVYGGYSSGADQLAAALFVAETNVYLMRLSKVTDAVQKAIDAYEDESALADRADGWSSRLESLINVPQRQRHEQEQYRRMARLKAVDQTAEAVLSSCSHIMEQFMETVTADLAATSAAASAAEAAAASEALQMKTNYSFLSILRSFLNRTGLPFGVRLAAYLSTAKTYQANKSEAAAQAHAEAEAKAEAKAEAEAEQAGHAEAEQWHGAGAEVDAGWSDNGYDHNYAENYDYDPYDDPERNPDRDSGEQAVPPTPPSLLPFSLSPSLAQQTALLERHVTEDMPAVTSLYENQLKEVLLQAIFPIADNSRNSLEKTFALRRAALDMTLEALMEARLHLIEYGATIVMEEAPALAITDGSETHADGVSCESEMADEFAATESTGGGDKDAYGNFRVGAVVPS